MAKYSHNTMYGSQSPAGSDDPQTPAPSRRLRNSRGKSRLAQEIDLFDSGNLPSNDEAAANTAEQYILSHLASHSANDQTSARSAMPLESTSYADFLPHDSLDSQIDPNLPAPPDDEHPLRLDTPSVLSRLKKGAPGSCDICGRTETSVWRKLTLGGEDYKVCNGKLRLPERDRMSSDVGFQRAGCIILSLGSSVPQSCGVMGRA